MLPVWNCAYPLTAKSERHSAAAMTARNLGVGHRFIAAPFIDGVLSCRTLAQRAGSCDAQASQGVTSVSRWPKRGFDSILRSRTFRLLNPRRRHGVPRMRGIVSNFFRKAKKKMPAGKTRRAGSTRDGEQLEGDLRSHAPHARRLQLADAPAGAAGRGGRDDRLLVLQDERVPLQNCALVRRVEQIAGERQTEPIRNAEVLGDAKVELVDILETERADIVEHDGEVAAAEAGHGVAERGWIALPRGEARTEVDVPRSDEQTGEVEVPLRVDEVVCKRAGTGRLRRDLAARTCAEGLRRIGAAARLRVGTATFGVVVIAGVGAHHPAMRQPLGGGHLEAAELLRIV